MGDDDVLILVGRRKRFQLVLIQSGRSVGSEQSLVLSHAQWLAFLPGEGPILRKQLPIHFVRVIGRLKIDERHTIPHPNAELVNKLNALSWAY